MVDSVAEFAALENVMLDGNAFSESMVEKLSGVFGDKLKEMEDNLSEEEEEEEDDDDESEGEESEYESGGIDEDDAVLTAAMEKAKI